MDIIWVRFIPALVLLFYPLDVFLRGHIRLRDYEAIRNQKANSSSVWWRQPWIWVDPLRAFVGAWLLSGAWIVDPLVPGIWHHLPFAGLLGVLLLALGVQMHTQRDTEVLFAPLGYCVGIVFALLPPQVAVLIIASAGACLMAFRSWSAFFLCGAMGAGIFGYLILKVSVEVVAGVILMGAPLLLSLLANRELMLPLSPVRVKV